MSRIHPSAQIALFVGGALGIGLVIFERVFPKLRPYSPSPAAFGLAFTTPGYNCISMFVGALIALILEKRNPPLAERTIIPTSSGVLAGEAITGIVIALLAAVGVLAA